MAWCHGANKSNSGCHIGTSVSQAGYHTQRPSSPASPVSVGLVKPRERVSERELARSLLPPGSGSLFDCDWEILNFSGCRVYFNFVWNYTKFSPLVLPPHTHLGTHFIAESTCCSGMCIKGLPNQPCKGKSCFTLFPQIQLNGSPKLNALGEKKKNGREICVSRVMERRKSLIRWIEFINCAVDVLEKGMLGETILGGGTTDQYLSPLFFFGVVKCSWIWFIQHILCQKLRATADWRGILKSYLGRTNFFSKIAKINLVFFRTESKMKIK